MRAFIRRIRDAHTAVVGNRVRVSLGGRSPVVHRGLYPDVATPDTRDDLDGERRNFVVVRAQLRRGNPVEAI